MTTIIAIESPHIVQIGYDSLATGHSSFDLEQPKVFVNNGVVYGVAGRLSLATELKHSQLPKLPAPGTNLDSWVTSTLIPRIRTVLNRGGGRMGEDNFEISMLIVVNERVYQISGDLGWHRRTDGIYAVGSGSPFAAGALYSGSGIATALQIAKDSDPYTGGKLTVTTASKLLKEGTSNV